jgi:hypothetical protein
MELTQTIRRTIENFNGRSAAYEIESWEQNDIGGLPITEPIFAKILHGEFLAADITYLNENVAFEIGLAIGSKKRALLFASSAHVGDRSLANDIGIFDTLQCASFDEDVAEKIIGFLLYYGVIGIRRTGNDLEYIYDVSYDVEMLNARIRKWGSRPCLQSCQA